MSSGQKDPRGEHRKLPTSINRTCYLKMPRSERRMFLRAATASIGALAGAIGPMHLPAARGRAGHSHPQIRCISPAPAAADGNPGTPSPSKRSTRTGTRSISAPAW
jgi:hypothetical protein